MGFDFLSQAAKFLQEQKNYKRWLAVFLCLAVTTVFGTAAALKMYGQAMTHQVKVLECQYEVHEHTDDCYEKDENGDPTGDPICGYADYVVHVHNDDCYDENGNLVCPLEEIEPHEHDENCYEETEVLVCEEGESESVSGHQHTDACYTEVQGELICEESTEGGHTHDDSCYSSELTCDLEEHTHDDGCYSSELACSDESEEHEHDDGCYSEELTCGQDEHTHGDGCYSETLTCGQEESTAHEHTDACYGTKKELTCTQGESESVEGHTHDDSCYETEETLTCEELELHTHVEALAEDGGCYDESAFDGETGEFIEGSRPVCGIPQLEEHVHTEECFKTVELTPEEIAALENGAKLHVHTEECYDEEGNLICTLLEKETEVHEHDMHCYDSEGRLVCGNEDAKDHEHDAKCYDEEGNLTCGYEGVKDHEHDADCYDVLGNLICEYEGVEDHVHTEACYDEEGNLICGYEVVEVYDNSKTFECDDYVIVARYNEDALIPEDAELLAEQITADDDEEHYARREAEYQEIMEDETASMKALLKIGFYMDGEEEGEKVEVEPATPVTMTIQFLDEDGLAEGSPITVVHFAEEGSEKLDGGKAKDSSTTFRISSFSEIAVGYGPEETEENKDPLPVKVQVSKSYEYEDPMFRAVFHVEGDIVMPDGLLSAAEGDGQPTEEEASPEDDGQSAEEETSPEDDEQPTKEDASSEESELPEENAEVQEEEDVQPEESGAAAETEEEEEAVTATEAEAADQTAEANYESEDGDIQDGEAEESSTEDAVILTEEELAGTMEFVVEPLGEDSEEHKAAAVVYSDDGEEMFLNRVLSYYLTYEGVKLDLTDCSVTMEVTPTQALVDYAEEATTEETVEGEKVRDEVTLSIIDFVSDEDTQEDAAADAEEQAETTESELMDDADSDAADGTDAVEGESADDTGADAADADEPEATETALTAEVLDAIPVTSSAMSQPMRIALRAVGTENTVGANATSQANPTFTVEFYAYLDMLVTDAETISKELGKKPITVIDTSGASLPKDGVTLKTKSIGVKDVNTSDGRVLTHEELKEIYSPGEFQYILAPGLVYFNKIAKNDSYVLKEIQVQRANSNTWETYSCENKKEWHFTNKPQTQKEDPDNFILITSGAKIRLVHTAVETERRNGVDFYDYDVSDGNLYLSSTQTPIKPDGSNRPEAVDRKVDTSTTHNSGATWYMYTNRQGINSNLSDQTFGFGNSEGTMRTTLGEKRGNKANASNAAYGSPTFGLVTGLVNGEIQYANDVKAPNLFDDKAANGKTNYTGKLVFSQKGDTYTLTGAEVIEKEGEEEKVVSSVYELDQFKRQRDNWNKKYYFAGNDFYPLDTVDSAGTPGHDLKFGAADTEVLQNFGGYSLKVDGGDKWTLSAPESDDGKNHNHYFGMRYTVEFDLVKDYVGPLEYLFYGDDDMWVFLDGPGHSGQLICDIGGVHSSVGEYVNLWDYITKGTEGHYKLTFFYTERGASGSTCWMQFTLPSVTFATTEQDTGKLEIEKKVTGPVTDEEFGFKVNFEDSSGEGLKNDYSYTKFNSQNVVIGNDILIWNNAKFTLKAGERIVVNFLPDGSRYTIEEIGPVTVKPTEPGEGTDWEESPNNNPYIPETSGGTSSGLGKVTGVINVKTASKIEVKYNNVLKFALPETGGPGTEVYAAAGALLILLSAGFVYKKKFRERRV